MTFEPKQLHISRVEYTGHLGCRIYLSDGSELIGVRSAETKAKVDEVSTIELSAYMREDF